MQRIITKMASATTTKPLTINSTAKLASGHEMPLLGYGVYQIPADDCPRLVLSALSHGYRHIDSATVYRNEGACAEAIHTAATHATKPIPRSDIFFTTKLPPKCRGYDETRESIRNTIDGNPGLEGYVDLYLIHAPFGGREARLGQWRAMRDAWKEGVLRSLGVSNYSIAHMEELREWIEEEEKTAGEKGAGGVISVGQWEIHPWCPRHDILAYCRTHNIIPQAYSPIVRGKHFIPPPTPENPNPSIPQGSEYLYQLAEKYGKTPAQILIRWSLQMGCVPLPKSEHEERIKENMGVFGWGLEEDEVRKLDTGKYEPVCWDPVKQCED